MDQLVFTSIGSVFSRVFFCKHSVSGAYTIIYAARKGRVGKKENFFKFFWEGCCQLAKSNRQEVITYLPDCRLLIVKGEKINN